MTALPTLSRLASPRPMPISREQYAQMAELGMFEGRRVQLINGAIIEMSPMGAGHRDALRFLNRVLTRTLTEFDVLVQIPVDASEVSQPEPDIALIPIDTPRGPVSSAPLVIEVSDSTLKFDLGEKAQLYAEAKVPEYWVIDLKNKVTVVHSAPKRGKYTKLRRVQWTTTLSSISIPELTLKLSEVL